MFVHQSTGRAFGSKLEEKHDALPTKLAFLQQKYNIFDATSQACRPGD